MSRADNRNRIAQVASRGQQQGKVFRQVEAVPAPAPGTCGSCHFHPDGSCWRYPPSVFPGGQTRPRTQDDEFCGEHKPVFG